MKVAETMAGVNLTCAHSPSETVPAHADYALPAESGFTRMRAGRITTLTLTLLWQGVKTPSCRGDGRATLPRARRVAAAARGAIIAVLSSNPHAPAEARADGARSSPPPGRAAHGGVTVPSKPVTLPSREPRSSGTPARLHASGPQLFRDHPHSHPRVAIAGVGGSLSWLAVCLGRLVAPSHSEGRACHGSGP
jgi:hypothetical protein